MMKKKDIVYISVSSSSSEDDESGAGEDEEVENDAEENKQTTTTTTTTNASSKVTKNGLAPSTTSSSALGQLNLQREQPILSLKFAEEPQEETVGKNTATKALNGESQQTLVLKKNTSRLPSVRTMEVNVGDKTTLSKPFAISSPASVLTQGNKTSVKTIERSAPTTSSTLQSKPLEIASSGAVVGKLSTNRKGDFLSPTVQSETSEDEALDNLKLRILQKRSADEESTLHNPENPQQDADQSMSVHQPDTSSNEEKATIANKAKPAINKLIREDPNGVENKKKKRRVISSDVEDDGLDDLTTKGGARTERTTEHLRVATNGKSRQFSQKELVRKPSDEREKSANKTKKKHQPFNDAASEGAKTNTSSIASTSTTRKRNRTKRNYPKTHGDLHENERIEVDFELTNNDTGEATRVWWPATVLKKVSRAPSTWKVKYDPISPHFTTHTFGLLRYKNDHVVCVKGTGKEHGQTEHFWRLLGDDEFRIFSSDDEDANERFRHPKALVKGAIERKDEYDYDDEDDDASEAEQDAKFFVDDDYVESVTMTPIELPSDAFRSTIYTSQKSASYSRQRAKVKHGLWCSKCREKRPPDSFSRLMKKEKNKKVRFCLAHTASSGFNKPAVIKV
jgi:hypothetical protein